MADGDLVFADDRNRTRLSRGAKDGRLRRLARGIYTEDLDNPAEDIVTRHRWAIVAHLIPDAVIVDRSAASGGAPAHDTLFVASKQRTRDVELPGLRIAVRDGQRLASDLPWASDLAIASQARTLVDNLAVSRGRGRVARTLSREELGDWVARQARLSGEERLNRLRDEAKQVAAELGVPERRADIDAFIGAALGTQPAPTGTASTQVHITKNAFDPLNAANAYSPNVVHIKVGDTVEWINDDAIVHTVTADDKSFDSGDIAKAKRWSHKFTTAGTYAYHCTPHPSMKGTIIVDG